MFGWAVVVQIANIPPIYKTMQIMKNRARFFIKNGQRPVFWTHFYAVKLVLNGILFRPLPYDHPERLVVIWETDPGQADATQAPPIAEMVDWKKQNDVFEDIALNSFIDRASISESGPVSWRSRPRRGGRPRGVSSSWPISRPAGSTCCRTAAC